MFQLVVGKAQRKLNQKFGQGKVYGIQERSLVTWAWVLYTIYIKQLLTELKIETSDEAKSREDTARVDFLRNQPLTPVI